MTEPLGVLCYCSREGSESPDDTPTAQITTQMSQNTKRHLAKNRKKPKAAAKKAEATLQSAPATAPPLPAAAEAVDLPEAAAAAEGGDQAKEPSPTPAVAAEAVIGAPPPEVTAAETSTSSSNGVIEGDDSESVALAGPSEQANVAAGEPGEVGAESTAGRTSALTQFWSQQQQQEEQQQQQQGQQQHARSKRQKSAAPKPHPLLSIPSKPSSAPTTTNPSLLHSVSVDGSNGPSFVLGTIIRGSSSSCGGGKLAGAGRKGEAGGAAVGRRFRGLPARRRLKQIQDDLLCLSVFNELLPKQVGEEGEKVERGGRREGGGGEEALGEGEGEGVNGVRGWEGQRIGAGGGGGGNAAQAAGGGGCLDRCNSMRMQAGVFAASV